MSKQPVQTLPGTVTVGGTTIAVQARYASKYSIWVDLKGVQAETVGLVLDVNDRNVDIGTCSLLHESDGNGGQSRLVSTQKIQDFDKLFTRSKIETLESTTTNLALILGYKSSIDENFRRYVANLTYDLSVYANLLDQLDNESSEEPPQVRELIQLSIIKSVGKGLSDLMVDRYAELQSIVKDYSEQEHEHHGYYFRRQLWSFLLRAPVVARTNLKPRGYNGDSEMMRMIYANDYRGESSFGKVLHKYSVEMAAAEAVRNRRGVLADMIRAQLQGLVLAKGEKMRALSVACGPAREINDIMQSRQDCERMHFSLLDQDAQALLEASETIGEVETKYKTEISVDFIRESVRTMLFTAELRSRWGNFNFIYSMGLFDYLTAPVASTVIKKLYQLLLPGGTMVIGNMVSGSSSQFYMEYWLDWKILYRSEEDLRLLAKDLPDAKVTVSHDGTGIQMLLILEKIGKQ